MVVDWEKRGLRASVSTEKVAQVSKRNQLIAPPTHTHTVIDTWCSSGVIRMGACVGTPGNFQS